jgi:hypothetical protein
MKPKNTITVQLRGMDNDHGDIRLEDLIKKLAAVKKSLADMDRLVGNEGKVYYRVVDLTHNSPATVELEPVAISPGVRNVAGGSKLWYTSVESIQDEKPLPKKLDYYALQGLKELTQGLGTRIPEMLVRRTGNPSVEVSPSLEDRVNAALGAFKYEVGSFTGRLEQINIHDGKNAFTLWSTVRLKRLTCIFPTDLKPDAIAAIDHYAKVYGRFRYHANFPQPIDIHVARIEIMPKEGDIPSLMELRGSAPDATRGVSSEDFVRQVRDAW